MEKKKKRILYIFATNRKPQLKDILRMYKKRGNRDGIQDD